MTHKDKISHELDVGVKRALEGSTPTNRLKAIVGIANVVREYDTYLKLLLGEQQALIEINKQQGNK